jgi:hypothetical protein
VSPPQLVRAGEIVRGIHVEEEELRIAEAPHLRQREDTDPDAGMEADGFEIPLIEAGGNGLPASGAVAGAEGLYPAASVALGQDRIMGLEAGGKASHQRLGDERHVPGYADHRCGRFHHRGIDPSQRAKPRPDVGYHLEIRPPGRRLPCIGNE